MTAYLRFRGVPVCQSDAHEVAGTLNHAIGAVEWWTQLAISGHPADTGSLNISLTPEQVRFIQAKVGTGRYQTAAEVVREGIRLLMERDAEAQHRFDAWRNELRRHIDTGLREAERGELIEGEKVVAEVKKAIRRRRKS